eukprot:6206871-Pyramimonas_sp.AAC.1
MLGGVGAPTLSMINDKVGQVGSLRCGPNVCTVGQQVSRRNRWGRGTLSVPPPDPARPGR